MLMAACGAIVGVVLNAWIDRLLRETWSHGGRRWVRWAAVEVVTSLMFAVGTREYGIGTLLASRLLFGSALIVLFVTDLERHVLPNVVVLSGTLVGLVFSTVTEPGWFASILGTVGGGALLLGIGETYHRVRGEEGLGMGDVKMLAMVGSFVGWKLAIVTLSVASLAGSAVGLGLVLARRSDMQSALPFGSFLAVSAAFAATAGQTMLGWYLGRW